MPHKRPRGEDREDEAPLPTVFNEAAGRTISFHEITIMRMVQGVLSTSGGLNRPISPPPTKRQRSSRPDISNAVQQRKSNSSPNITNVERVDLSQSKVGSGSQDFVIVSCPNRRSKQISYLKISQEAYHVWRINDPRQHGGSGNSQQDPSIAKLEKFAGKGISKSLEHVEVDRGGFVLVEWGEDSSQSVKRPDRGTVGESSTANSVPGADHLCHACKRVVKGSTVMHTPWRKVGEVETSESSHGEPFTIQEELNVDFKGPKVNTFKHHAVLGTLRRSASAGCDLCALLDSDNPEVPLTYDEKSSMPYILKVVWSSNHDQGPGVILLIPRGGEPKVLYMYYETPPPISAPTLKETITDTEPILELAKNWLNECLTIHEACRARATQPTSFVPTRLIKVKGHGKCVDGVSLVFGCELPLDTKYLTLSHCWGGADIIKLTKDTIDDFEIDIPRFRLPKNFSDAMAMTSILGYEYIWIDSLCIIQDSAEDWKREAALMGLVYRHSVCTIAAVGAKDPYGGCFMQRSALSFIPCQLIPRTTDHPGVYVDRIWASPQPLHNRAWVVQERCLSVRTLNFGSSMVSWDCIAAKASELEPEMRKTIYGNSLKRTFYNLLDYPMDKPNSRLGQSHWRANWWDLLREYSDMNISFATDKWPAMQGMGTEVEKDRKQKLVHGLWKYAIADEILWRIHQPKVKRLDIGAPSWSWLSIEGQVHKWFYNYIDRHRIDATVALSPESPSELKIIGRMLRLTWVQASRKSDYTPSFSFRLRDGRPRAPVNGLPDWDGRWIPDTVPDEKWETWALQIVKSRDDEELKERGGLVVVPVPGKRDTWRRVGFYDFIWRDWSHVDVTVGKRWFGYWTAVTLI